MLPTKLLFGRSKRGSKTIWKSTYMKKWTKPPWTRFIPVLGPSRGHKSVVKQREFEDFHFGYWRRLEDHFGAILVPSCLPKRGSRGALFGTWNMLKSDKKAFEKRIQKSIKKHRSGRLPDGKCQGGWRAMTRSGAPTVYSSLIATKLQDSKIQNSKTLSLQENSIDSKTLSLIFENSSWL